MSRGRTARSFGELAEEAFRETLRVWFGDPLGRCWPVISVDYHDEHGIDFRCDVQSVTYRPSCMSLNFQVKATSASPVYSTLYNEQAYSVEINPYAVEHARASGRPTFIVVGAPAVPMSEMWHYPPIKRFRWYAIELHVYLTRLAVIGEHELPKRIHVPVRNRLNAAVASLLWGSWWVAESLESLWAQDVEAVGDLAAIRKRYITNSIAGSSRGDEVMRDADADAFRNAVTKFPAGRAQELNLHFGAAFAIRSIQREILDVAPSSYLSYASEAAREEINLWLFSKLYREHLRVFSPRFASSRGGRYVRFLPVLPPEQMPRHLLLAHVHASRVHRAAGIAGVLEWVPESRGLVDRILIGGTSFNSRFIDVTDGWSVVIDRGGRSNEDRDFFERQLRQLTIPNELEYREMKLIAGSGLPEEERRLPVRPPLDLFAPETVLLEHPDELWSAHAAVMTA